MDDCNERLGVGKKLDVSKINNSKFENQEVKIVPSRDRHLRVIENVNIKNNKTFWSSGFERPINSIPKLPVLSTSPKPQHKLGEMKFKRAF